MGLFPDTRFDDWTRQDVGSFAKRYFEPMWRVAKLDFPWIDIDRAQDLAQGFLVRELTRDPVFERYEPTQGHDAKFRTYLRTCFFRYSRDQLEKERRRQGSSLDAMPVEPADDSSREFERLVARDFLARLRADVQGGLADEPEASAYFEAKWPADIDAPVPSDAEIGRLLELTRARLRTVKKKAVERILLALRQRIHQDGLRMDVADAALESYFGILGDEDARSG